MKTLYRSTIPIALSLIAAPVRAAETKEHAFPTRRNPVLPV